MWLGTRQARSASSCPRSARPRSAPWPTPGPSRACIEGLPPWRSGAPPESLHERRCTRRAGWGPDRAAPSQGREGASCVALRERVRPMAVRLVPGQMTSPAEPSDVQGSGVIVVVGDDLALHSALVTAVRPSQLAGIDRVTHSAVRSVEPLRPRPDTKTAPRGIALVSRVRHRWHQRNQPGGQQRGGDLHLPGPPSAPHVQWGRG